ncbi:unnamed protein product [Ectocarpus sp. CCAP 1310/34]|nr:unnamed protein product [Ectocarpus sp. CCAP 1310/34]
MVQRWRGGNWLKEFQSGAFFALVPYNSKEQSVVYRPLRLIVAAEW